MDRYIAPHHRRNAPWTLMSTLKWRKRCESIQVQREKASGYILVGHAEQIPKWEAVYLLNLGLFCWDRSSPTLSKEKMSRMSGSKKPRNSKIHTKVKQRLGSSCHDLVAIDPGTSILLEFFPSPGGVVSRRSAWKCWTCAASAKRPSHKCPTKSMENPSLRSLLLLICLIVKIPHDSRQIRNLSIMTQRHPKKKAKIWLCCFAL